MGNENVSVELSLTGRRELTSTASEITRQNVVKVLAAVLADHLNNAEESEYLYKYYKGEQPIRYRKKKVRPDINNKVLVNRANEIVSFKTGYLVGEPIQYIGVNEKVTDDVNRLNSMMRAISKHKLDKEIVDWQHIAGTAYRMVLPAKEYDGVPFGIWTLPPDDTFVVYRADFKREPLMGVYVTCVNGTIPRYCIYTDKFYCEVESGAVVRGSYKPHSLGMVPIIEYPANSARLGAFEIVLAPLNAINMIESNRVDGIEQFVQSLMKFINCDIDKEKFEQLAELGAIKVSSPEGKTADVQIITSELNQSQTQVTVSDMYDTVLTICGMPNRNGGSSTSDTGSAVIMRDGWSAAEARAKDSETMFSASERRMLQLVLRILRDSTSADIALTVDDLDVKFTRRNYDAIQSKSQVLISMLAQPKIHPLLAFTHSGMFSDPEAAYLMSKKYSEEMEKKMQEQQAKLAASAPANDTTKPDEEDDEPEPDQADGDKQPASA